MILLGLVLGLLVLGIVVVVLELRGPTVEVATAGQHVRVVGALAALAMMAIGPALLLVEDRRLPVERPAERWDEGPAVMKYELRGGCSGLGDDPTVLAIALAVAVALRLGPALAAMAVVAPPRVWAREVPSGRRALRVANAVFAVVGGLAMARVVAGGAPPSAFTTYGALTPAGAGGWRVDAALALALGPRRPVEVGPPWRSWYEYFDMDRSRQYPELPEMHELWSLLAWVDGAPVRFYVSDEGGVVGSRFGFPEPPADMLPYQGEPLLTPPERRPHFRAWPALARLDEDHLVIVGPAADGGVLAVKVNRRDLTATAATFAEVGLLVRPRWWPWLLGAAVAAVAVALARRGRRRDDPADRMLAAWLLLEAAAILIYGYATAFGLTLV